MKKHVSTIVNATEKLGKASEKSCSRELTAAYGNEEQGMSPVGFSRL